MKGRDILEALSFIDESYVNEAENLTLPKRHWRSFAAMAACLCLILAGAYMIQTVQIPMENEGAGIPEMMPEFAPEGVEAAEGGADLTAGANVPLIVEVEKRTEYGLIGTVVNSVGELNPGTKVEVLPAEGAEWNLPEDVTQVSVGGYSYDPENQVIYAAWIGKDD